MLKKPFILNMVTELSENNCSDIQLEQVGDEGLWGKDARAPPWNRDCVEPT